MSGSLRAELARLVDARRRGTRLVLLFDYDGTLVPIVEHPSMAVVERGHSAPTRAVGVDTIDRDWRIERARD